VKGPGLMNDFSAVQNRDNNAAVEALISQAKECLKVLPERAAGIREQKQIDE